jgi:hypothetical protein
MPVVMRRTKTNPPFELVAQVAVEALTDTYRAQKIKPNSAPVREGRRAEFGASDSSY